jgi:hypothetical protein
LSSRARPKRGRGGGAAPWCVFTLIMASTNRKAVCKADEPHPFLCDVDAIIMVLAKLTKMSDVASACRVCQAWATAALCGSAWECVVKTSYPPETHAAVYSSFSALGITDWKARCKLLCQRVPSADYSRHRQYSPNGGCYGPAFMNQNYTFVIAVADAMGNAVSLKAQVARPRPLPLTNRRTCLDSRSDSEFSLKASLDTDAELYVGVDCLSTEEYRDPVRADGFGTATIDVFVRRTSDDKVAHMMRCDFNFESLDVEVFDRAAGMEMETTMWDIYTPQWLADHMYHVDPLKWSFEYDRPKWGVSLTAFARKPSFDDDITEARTGKWTGGLRLDFLCNDEDCPCGDELAIGNDFMAQALAGRALQWI